MDTPYDLDFGLTGFSSQFHQDWRYGGSAEDVLRQQGLNTERAAKVDLLRNDARLARAGLSSSAVEALWLAGTEGFWFGRDSPSGTAWLDTIVAATDRWFAERPGAETLTWPVHNPVGAVLAEIETFGRFYRGIPHRQPAPEVLAALADCARTCSADLALRFLLRAFIGSSLLSSPEWYERLHRLGNEIGYGEFVIGHIDSLVVDDPDPREQGQVVTLSQPPST